MLRGTTTTAGAVGAAIGGFTAAAAWVPTDLSGAGLTFTSVSGRYTRIGNMVFASAQLTFPVTADGSAIAISLPVAVPNLNYAQTPSILNINTGSATIYMAVPTKNTSGFSIINHTTGAAVINSGFATQTITVSIIYPAT